MSDDFGDFLENAGDATLAGNYSEADKRRGRVILKVLLGLLTVACVASVAVLVVGLIVAASYSP